MHIIDTIKDQSAYTLFNNYFASISDPRQISKIKHLLSEILFITVLAIIAGAEDFEDIALFAKTKFQWLSTFLKLPGGIPSHDTFNRVLCMLSPQEFEQSFISWVSDYRTGIAPTDEKDIICVDGKTICNSGDKIRGSKAIHMVSALSTKYGLILGQRKCEEKSNEITAIPALLALLDIRGTIITIDAMGCQKKIAKKIISKMADYILALKENQGNLYKEVVDLFDKVKTPEFAHYIEQQDTEIDKGHGRIETRHCIIINNLKWLYEIHQWEGVKCIVKITSTVIKNDKETEETRYYISSLYGNARLINRAIRKHWHIENKLHWVLDVLFKEDYCRVRSGNGAENLSIVRRIALNKLKADTTFQGSLKAKRKRAAWNDNYACKIFSEMMK
ncbi:ISAs1 family transposase [Candidatus Poribacteria bacterium]|nr:ISAs1 family transposase [Candidatus Poribacteria bacterium]